MSEQFNISEPYAPRPIRFLGLYTNAGWRIKLYSITYGEAQLDRPTYDTGLSIALADLPQPAISAHRPGVGFAILHQGRGWHYLVLNWWDNENEWFSGVYVKRMDGDENWRRATNGEAACVWDLQVIWFEREMYVKHVLMSRDGVNVDGYLAEQFKS